MIGLEIGEQFLFLQYIHIYIYPILYVSVNMPLPGFPSTESNQIATTIFKEETTTTRSMKETHNNNIWERNRSGCWIKANMSSITTQSRTKGQKRQTRWMERVATSTWKESIVWVVDGDIEECGSWVGDNLIFLVVKWTKEGFSREMVFCKEGFGRKWWVYWNPKS